MKKNVVWPHETTRIFDTITELAPNGIFATGIENSDPVVDGKRRNQLKEAHDFYQNWEKRIDQISELGIKWLRFGEGYSFTHLGKDSYNFELTAKVINKCDELGINIIIDLLHFGLPEWIHKKTPNTPYFQNPEFPYHFAEYVKVFAKFFPSIKYFTIVNEPTITARFSAVNGIWNEQKTDEKSFVKAIVNIARAAILGKEEIENVWKEEKREGHPLFFQNDSFEKAIAAPDLISHERVNYFNNFAQVASLDLIFGHHNESVKMQLLKTGVTNNEYEWFMKYGNTHNSILGIDHYPRCVHVHTNTGINSRTPKDEYQLAAIVREAWNRYPLPLLHMEVNALPEDAVDLCRKTYDEIMFLKNQGYPVIGMSWFGDDLQVGWETLLTGPQAQDEYRVGLFYKGEKEPVADLFMQYSNKGFSLIAAPHMRGNRSFFLNTRLVKKVPVALRILKNRVAEKPLGYAFVDIGYTRPTRFIKRLVK